MVLARELAFRTDGELSLLTDFDSSFGHLTEVDYRSSQFAGLHDLEQACRGPHGALVANLTALFRVEASFVCDQTEFFLLRYATRTQELVVRDPAAHLRLANRAAPLGSIVCRGQAACHLHGNLRGLGAARLGELAPQFLIALFVQAQAPLLGHLPRQVRREAVGCMQIEYGLASDCATVLLRQLCGLFEPSQAALDRTEEIAFFTSNHVLHAVGIFRKL